MSLQPIFEVYESCYEWVWFGLYRHPVHPGRFTTLIDSGCSCNDFAYPSDEEIRASEPINRGIARTDLTDFLNCYKEFIDKGDAVRYLERFETVMSEQTA